MSVWPGGAPQFGGGKLMREDLVVITVEYRSACDEDMWICLYMLILFIVLTCFLLLKHPLIPQIFRTGLLGFLSDETRELPGNLGLTDVALALDWVQQAVADFGGNPGSVTLAGWGQGAVIAHLLSLNPTTASKCHLSEIMLVTCLK